LLRQEPKGIALALTTDDFHDAVSSASSGDGAPPHPSGRVFEARGRVDIAAAF
jgi:hypothetical protein